MFLHFIRRLLKAFRYPNRKSYSVRWFFGKILYYDKNGVQIGYSVRRFWSGRKRYDMNDNLISYTRRNFWGGYDTYDANDNLISKSYRNFWGGYNTYNLAGKKIRESYPSFWGGMNYFDVDDSHPAEFYSKKFNYSQIKQKTSTQNQIVKPNTTSNSVNESSNVFNDNQKKTRTQSSTVNTAKKEEIKECSAPISQSICKGQSSDRSQKHISQSMKKVASDVNKKLDYNNLFQQNIDKTIPFYETLSDFNEEQQNIDDCVKILVFSYGDLKEFPACVYGVEEQVKVCPLVRNIPPFLLDRSEIYEAKKKVVEGLEMEVIDNEFASLCASKIITEFDDLFPEYEYKSNGIARVQYEFKCGIAITEKSWLQMIEAFSD